jgi:O-acetyl-ADP-ribose deacetylase (regulator of RNase III)
MNPHIYLVDRNQSMVEAWQEFCGKMDEVTIIHGSVVDDTKWDAFVSPANSFGFMNGGVDLAYSEHYGWDIQRRLQIIIQRDHYGELLVGDCIWLGTGDKKVPFMFSAPTMRVPVQLEKETVNPYLATRAVLMCYQSMLVDKNKIKSIAFPGMGTGIGGVDPRLCAKQMHLAIERVRNGYAFPKKLREATVDQYLNLTKVSEYSPEADLFGGYSDC